MINKQVLVIGLGCFVGATIFGIANCLLYYFIKKYAVQNSSFEANLGPIVMAIAGLILGIICGGILGGLISGLRLNIFVSFVLGFLVNGILPILLLLLFLGTTNYEITSKADIYFICGNFILGGILGIVMNLITRLEVFNFSDKTTLT